MTDGELVSRFVGSRDEAAFAALVTRLGPMVRAVCRSNPKTVATGKSLYSTGRPLGMLDWR